MKATVHPNRDHEPESLYETDFHAWTARTAALLRRRRFEAIDVEHAAEEIEDMGKRELKELNSRMRVLLLHLLKWQLQPRKRPRSWAATIVERHAIADDLEQSPSLRQRVGDSLPESYRRAVQRAAIETGMAYRRFPARCPYSLEQILNENYLPEQRATRIARARCARWLAFWFVHVNLHPAAFPGQNGIRFYER